MFWSSESCFTLHQAQHDDVGHRGRGGHRWVEASQANISSRKNFTVTLMVRSMIELKSIDDNDALILKIMPIEKVYWGLVGGGGVGRVPEVLP